MCRAFVMVMGLVLCATPIAAQDAAKSAQNAASQLAAASSALENAQGARNRVNALTQTIKAYEEGLEALREGLRASSLREQEIERNWQARSAEVSQLLAALSSLQNGPVAVHLLHPDGPLGTARSGMMISSLTPALQAEADRLGAELEEVALLRTLQESARQDLSAGLKGVQTARTDLSKAISERSDLPKRYTSDPHQLTELVNNAETLDGFASGLRLVDGTESAPENSQFSSAKGTLPLPVAGTVLRNYQEADATGTKRPGLIIATRPLALIEAPWPATIRYRGPLLDYGNVMILEPEENYLLVLAGLERVYGEVGAVVPAGTPVGMMGGATPAAEEFLAQSTQGSGVERSETLYMELRERREPTDPTAWFDINKE
ncbi:MAG: peptidase M23 [Pseudoruegeria sp.]